MKKALTLITVILLSSCHTPHVENPSRGDDEAVFIHVGSKILQVHQVTLNKYGDYIYLLTPKDTTIKIEVVGYGDSHETVIEVK